MTPEEYNLGWKMAQKVAETPAGHVVEMSLLELKAYEGWCIRDRFTKTNIPNDIEATLKERGSSYGESFSEQAKIAQSLKFIMHSAPKWGVMHPDQKEALEMIATKLSRLLYGDPNHLDSWHDIIGYARLIEKVLTPATEGAK